MATCAKCGAALAAAAKFCGACGARVTASSLPPPPRVSVPGADPFAKTVFGGDTGPSPQHPPSPAPPQARPQTGPVGPSAPPGPPAQPRTQPHQQAYAPPGRSPSAPPRTPPPPGPAPGASPPQTPLPTGGALARGAPVLVHWADGNRYPATVLHTQGNHVLVLFPTGQQQWVDSRYVSSG
jgi:hypothetical protein